MARPNRKTKSVDLEAAGIEVIEETTATEEAAPAPAPKTVTVYSVNMETDEEHAERKAVKPDSVGGVMLGIIHDMEARGQMATKAAILEEFRATEKAASLRAAQWTLKPQEYVNGYIDWLKGNRSLVSAKAEV